MVTTGLRRIKLRLSRLKTRITGLFVQDCPDELYACEICNQIDCANDEWINCENRLQTFAAFRIKAKTAPRAENSCSYLQKEG